MPRSRKKSHPTGNGSIEDRPAKCESLSAKARGQNAVPKLLPPVQLIEEDGAGLKLKISFPEAIRIGKALGTRNRLLIGRFAVQLAHMGLGSNREESLNAGLAFLDSLRVDDEAQAMLAMQMVQTHDMALIELRRAAKSKVVSHTDSAINRSAKLMRIFTAQLETLRRMQGKSGVQKVIVQHQHLEVHNEGGQSVVAAGQEGGVSGKS